MVSDQAFQVRMCQNIEEGKRNLTVSFYLVIGKYEFVYKLIMRVFHYFISKTRYPGSKLPHKDSGAKTPSLPQVSGGKAEHAVQRDQMTSSVRSQVSVGLGSKIVEKSQRSVRDLRVRYKEKLEQ